MFMDHFMVLNNINTSLVPVFRNIQYVDTLYIKHQLMHGVLINSWLVASYVMVVL